MSPLAIILLILVLLLLLPGIFVKGLSWLIIIAIVLAVVAVVTGRGK